MRKPFRISLQWQIFATVLAVLTVGAGSYTWISDNLMVSSMDRQLSQRLNIVAKWLQRELPWRQYVVYIPGDQVTQSYQNDFNRLQWFTQEFGLARITLLTMHGEVSLDSGTLNPGDVFEKKVVSNQIQETLLHRDPQHRWNKAYYYPLSSDTCLRLEAGPEMLNPIATLQSRRWLALSIGACLAFILSWFLSRRLGKRLSRLSEGFQRLENGEPNVQIHIEGQDEIAFVTRGFNTMATELEKRQQREKSDHERRISELRILAGGVAHEIRNPLGAIGGLGDLLVRQPDIANNSDSMDLLKRLRNEIDRMDGIVQDVLAYARQPQLQAKPLDMIEFLTQMHELYPDIQLEFAPPYPPLIADPSGLRTVLRNLLINARQATGPSGIVRLGCRYRPGRFLLYVADDGPGISDAILPNIFQPFFTQRPKGAGLGLAIAKNIVNAHGGELRVATPLNGALFVIVFPENKGV